MKRLHWLGVFLLSFAALAAAQDKVFDWVRASDEATQLDPMNYHAGRVYHPGTQGGNIRAVVQGIQAVLGQGARRFISPNDLKITYYQWDCVQNCIQPEFQWSVLVKEKYELSSAPKVYSLLTPERDGQPVWIRVKAPVPMTIALLPSEVADKIYDDPSTLASALESTSCKQRGVQSLNFSCNVNLGDGRQSLVVVPEGHGNVPHKKAEIEMQSMQCTENCDLLNQRQ